MIPHLTPCRQRRRVKEDPQLVAGGESIRSNRAGKRIWLGEDTKQEAKLCLTFRIIPQPLG